MRLHIPIINYQFAMFKCSETIDVYSNSQSAPLWSTTRTDISEADTLLSCPAGSPACPVGSPANKIAAHYLNQDNVPLCCAGCIAQILFKVGVAHKGLVNFLCCISALSYGTYNKRLSDVHIAAYKYFCDVCFAAAASGADISSGGRFNFKG